MEELIKMMEKLVNLPGQIAELEKKMQELEDTIVDLERKETRLLVDDDELLTIKQILEMYTVSRTKFYRVRDKHKLLPARMKGKRIQLYFKKDVERILFAA